MKRPTISIVISVLNGAATLQRCIESVLCQTYANRELVVIDGGSTDGTVQILERYASALAFWVSEPDRGIYHAWNKGLVRARGDWIQFLGADDYLPATDVYAQLIPILERAFPPARIVYGRVLVEGENGAVVQELGEAWSRARTRFTQVMPLPHTGVLHHRSFFEAHGIFDESFKIAGDYEMLLRELPEGEAVFVPELVLAMKRRGGVSTDPATAVRMMLEVRRAQLMHGLEHPGRLWRVAYAKARLRNRVWRLLGPRAAAYAFDLARMITGKPRYWTRQ